MRRKNVRDEKKRQVMKLLDAGLEVEQVARQFGLHKSTVYKIRSESQQFDSPHQQTLRKLAESWLSEVRQANPLAVVQPLLEQILSASHLRTIAAEHLQNEDGVSVFDTDRGRAGIPHSELEGSTWTTRIERDPLFAQLRCHLKHDRVDNAYEEMRRALLELASMIVYWSQGFLGIIVGKLGSKEGFDAWMKRLYENALYREHQIRITVPALAVLVCELFRLATTEESEPKVDSWKSVFEWVQPQFEHQLEISRSLYDSHLGADEICGIARQIWDDQSPCSNAGAKEIKDALRQALSLFLDFERSKNTVEQHLARTVEHYPFPGRCSACKL